MDPLDYYFLHPLWDVDFLCWAFWKCGVLLLNMLDVLHDLELPNRACYELLLLRTQGKELALPFFQLGQYVSEK